MMALRASDLCELPLFSISRVKDIETAFEVDCKVYVDGEFPSKIESEPIAPCSPMTTITLEIPPELEQQLREEAARQGLEPTRYILNALSERLRPAASQASLPLSETELLQQINLGLFAEQWKQYHAWIAKRRAETLTPDEQAALIALSDQIEQANARRMKALIELAKLRVKITRR
jgi:predicted HicB family RNase H-like nuclease